MIRCKSTFEVNMSSTGSQVRSLTQISELLDEFESNAEVLDEELAGSSMDINEAAEQEMDDMELANQAKSSIDQSRRYAERFKEFLRTNGLCDKIESLVPVTLAKFLRFFYHSLGAKNRDYLAPSSLGCIRAGINRYLTSPPYIIE